MKERGNNEFRKEHDRLSEKASQLQSMRMKLNHHASKHSSITATSKKDLELQEGGSQLLSGGGYFNYPQ